MAFFTGTDDGVEGDGIGLQVMLPQRPEDILGWPCIPLGKIFGFRV